MSKPIIHVVLLDRINIGTRHRLAMGNIDSLARSIEEVGLLHPIVVTPEFTLIAGERRIEAHRRLKRTTIPAYVVSLEAIVRGECDENYERKDFTPAEWVAIGEALEPLEKAAAEKRQKATLKRGNKKPVGETFPNGERGRSADRVARFCGTSGKSYERAKTIVKAAEEEPEKYAPLVEEMNRTGRANGVHKKLVNSRKAEAIRKETPPLPNKGPYRVVAADPTHRSANPYPDMTTEAICALKVASISHEDAILWLWTTNAHLREAFTVVDAWGFQSKTMLTWVKDKMDTGDWLRGQTEHCVLAVRGRPTVTLSNQTTALIGAP